jgi:hypothetical protein
LPGKLLAGMKKLLQIISMKRGLNPDSQWNIDFPAIFFTSTDHFSFHTSASHLTFLRLSPLEKINLKTVL